MLSVKIDILYSVGLALPVNLKVECKCVSASSCFAVHHVRFYSTYMYLYVD